MQVGTGKSVLNGIAIGKLKICLLYTSQQGFTFLGTLGKKYNSFAHKNQPSLISDEAGASAPPEEKR